MAKTKISEFSATPANNTDIDSINIAEGCAPSGINDAIRELMAQLKDFQTGAVGDSFNGPINGTVGATTASTGAFTTLTTTGTINLLTVGRGAGAVSTNTAVGASALAANTTGSLNTAVGYQTLFSNTTATNNTAVGYQAGFSNTTGGSNVFLGYQAGYTQTTGGAGAGANTYLGYRAGYLATGYYNTFVGIQAGQNSTGAGNTFIGSTGTYASGDAMTSGNNNTIVGNFSGNNDSLDIRTASNYAVISDGAGNRQITMKEGQTLALDSAVPNAGTGITFPATQSASSDANTLDDYEEGTWTSAITFGGGSTGNVYGNQLGNYTKIGNRVFISCYVSLSTKGSSTGNVAIIGLPFTSANYLFTGVCVWGNNLSSITGGLQGYNAPNTTTISEISYIGTGAQTPLTNSNLTNNSAFLINFSYSI